jgi:transposase
VHVGFDVGKQYVLTVARWGDGSFERPWLVNSPGEIGVLVDLLASVARQPALRLAMEPTGTYGDVLRQALGDAGLPLEQVSAKAVGVATACVLWVHLGDPSAYHCPQAYRKAMGLNLKECSSGIYPGQVRITQRGFGQVRRWLYFAALRLIRQGPVARWY